MITNKTILHTIREAPLEAALRTFDQHRSTPGAVDALMQRVALDSLYMARRVAKLETELLRMKRETA